jgi:hypothetical protein
MYKHYKDNEGNVFGFRSDGSQDEHIPTHLVPITDAEADILRKEVGKRAAERLAQRIQQQ